MSIQKGKNTQEKSIIASKLWVLPLFTYSSPSGKNNEQGIIIFLTLIFKF